MSQITRCPSCATAFKVVADQLRIAQGWVRCGQCKAVFDASAHLLVPLIPPPQEPQATAVDQVPTAPPAAAAAPQRSAPPALPETAAPAPAAVTWTQDMQDDFPCTILQTGPTESAQQDSLPEAEPQVGFMLAARRKAFWRKPAVRALLLGLLWLSILGLALQVVLQERDRIAAVAPHTRPWLVRLCQLLQCRIGPPRRIADLVIDSASFHKVRGDGYRLAFTVTNRSAMALAVPAVELTLTDTQDQPVLRRVLLPTEIAAPAALAPHGEWNAALSVVVITGGARVAGYRLLAFYP